jgi:hypothetical protein
LPSRSMSMMDAGLSLAGEGTTEAYQ